MKRVVWLRFPGIVAVVYLVFLTGCRSSLKSGTLKCATGSQPCPSGYYCETASNTCWANGSGPDSGTGALDSGAPGQTADSGTGNEKPDSGGIGGNAGDASSDLVAPYDGAAVLVDTAGDALAVVDVVAVVDTAVDLAVDRPVVVDVANDPSVGQPDLACAPDSPRCNDHQPQVCDQNGQWQNVGSACSYVCSASTATCIGVCTPGSKQCNLLQPQLCDDNGAWQNTGPACAHLCSGSTATCTGACTPTTRECNGTQPRTCDDTGTWQNTGNPCSGCNTCSSTTGTCVPATGPACDDGNPCTQTDTCQSGVCVGSNPKTCTALDQCHSVGTCDTATGLCPNPAKPNNTICDDGNPCTTGETCQLGSCTGGTAKTCSASDQCHIPGTCDTATGLCSNPAKPNSTTCDDGNACTTGETCQSGSCTGGTAKTCSALDQCHNVGTCDTVTGACSNPAKPNSTPCNDNNACTTGETCQTGVCTGGAAVTCPTPAACHLAGTCSGGICSNPIASNGTIDAKCPTSTPVCYSGGCVQCLTDTDCPSGTPLCNPSNHQCVQCLSIGGSSGAEWCPSNAPSCNLSTHQCACRIPSAGNLVQNPGFDTGAGSWIVSDTYWNGGAANDADGCAGSGSVAGHDTDGDPKQCVYLPAGSGTYYFGAEFNVSNLYNGSFCTVSFYSDTGCSTLLAGSTFDHMGPNGGYWPNLGWQSFFVTQTAPSGSQSALILCATDSAVTEIDQVYLNQLGTTF